MSDQNQTLLILSAQIVAAHAGHNHVGIDRLSAVIRNVYNTLANLNPEASREPDATSSNPAAHGTADHDHLSRYVTHANNVYVHPTYGPTVFDNHLICMEDGLPMKMLKRHLATVHGITPEEYRMKWGLPPDYPMVAADYAKLRSSLALQSGLGLKPEGRQVKRRRHRR